MKNLLSFAFFICLSYILIAQNNSNFQNFIDNRNKQAFKTYKRLEKTQQNEIFSPYILDFSFSEIYLATQKGTAVQIANVQQFNINKNLHFQNFDKYQHITDFLNSLNTNLKYSVNIFYPDSLKIQKNFSNNIKKIYIFDSIRPFKSNISKKNLAEYINKIIKKNTSDNIKNVFKQNNMPDKPNIIVSSAAYFSGHWANNFTNYIYSPFVLDTSGKSIKMVKYLTINDYFKYGESADYQIIQIPYEGFRLSLIIILPKKNINLKNTPDFFNYDSFKLWREQTLQTERVRLLIPEFSIENLYSLKNKYSKLMPSVFSKGGNFLNMIKSLVYVNGFYHFAKFKISDENENTQEIKSINFQKEQQTNGSIIFNANHPFLFFLIDKKTNAIIFIGHFNNPEQKD
jgi:serpin B